jgi:aminopeptidase N
MTIEERETLCPTILPTHYLVDLTPCLKTFKFAGKVVIDLDVTAPSNTITCNAVELEISSATILLKTGTTLTSTWTFDEPTGRSPFFKHT